MAANTKRSARAGTSKASQFDDTDAFHVVIMDLFDSEILPRRRAVRPDEAGEETHLRRAREKYARIFATYRGARVTKTIRRRKDKGEAPTSFGDIIKVHERIKSYTNRERGSLPSEAELVAFGATLFDTLFQGDVKQLYDEARARNSGRKLDLVLTSMIPWIAEKPWEFAYDQARRRFLATEDVHFVRNVLTAVPADTIAVSKGCLNILVVSAQPVGFGKLSIDQERKVIQRGFGSLIESGLANVKMLPRATPTALRRELASGDYSVVHFIGHGEFDEERGEGVLIFEDGDGGRERLGERQLRQIFCNRGLSLVFLNSCQSGTGGLTDFNKGVAQALVANGLPALVANQYSVLDASATSFAQEFYRILAQGHTLGEAAREARRYVNASLEGEIIDWAVPVVYARDPNQALCAPPGASNAGRVTPRRGSKRRRPATSVAARSRLTLAMWDMDGAFPSLEIAIERMNAAQSAFSFTVARTSTPIDLWDLGKKSPDGAPYLVAEKLAKRLDGHTEKMGVNVLVCLTRHRLRSDAADDLLQWRPASGKPAVLIHSFAGFRGIEPDEPTTERTLANVIVAALSEYLANLTPHDDERVMCPLNTNRQRQRSRLAAKQRFDAECRGELERKLERVELDALELLLAVFHPS